MLRALLSGQNGLAAVRESRVEIGVSQPAREPKFRAGKAGHASSSINLCGQAPSQLTLHPAESSGCTDKFVQSDRSLRGRGPGSPEDAPEHRIGPTQ